MSDEMSSIQYHLITADSPMNRYFVFNPPLFLGIKNGENITSPSLHHSFWYLMLLQLESDRSLNYNQQPLLSSQLLHNSYLRNNPKAINDWLHRRNVHLNGTWTVIIKTVYRNLVVHIISQNPFFRELIQMIEAGRPTQYFYAGMDRKYCIGLTENQFYRNLDHSGMNAWGRMLDDVSTIIRSGFEFKTRSNDGDLKFSLLKNPQPPRFVYQKAALVIIDSYGKFLKEISDGDFVRVGGGTFAMLANEVRKENVNFRDYHYIIILGGLNEVRRNESQQQRSWNDLRSLLLPEISRRQAEIGSETMLFCFTPPITREHRLNSHYSWMRNNLKNLGVSVLDWSTSCPFVDSRGKQRLEYFENDRVHLNHNGFREMWFRWSTILRGLEFVGFELSRSQYLREAERDLTDCM